LVEFGAAMMLFVGAPRAEAREYTGPAAISEAPGEASEPEPPPPPVEVPPAAVPTKSGPRLRASLQDGFGIDSADGRFGVSVNILATLAYEVRVSAAPTEQGFRIVYLRPTLRAHLFGQKLRFAFQPAFDGASPRLILGYATLDLHPAFGVHLGFYRPFYARGFIVGLEPLLLPDRGPAIDEFASPNDLGVTVFGAPLRGKLQYYVGAMNGEGFTNIRNVDPNMLFLARIAVNPLGPVDDSQTPSLSTPEPLPFRFSIAINGYTNETRHQSVAMDPADEPITYERRDIGAGGDIAMYWRRVSGLAEGFYRRRIDGITGSTHAWGTYAQVGVFAIRQRLEPAMRVTVMQLGDGVGVRVPLQPALNLYLAKNFAKLQLSYLCDLRTTTKACSTHAAVLQAQFSM
jgi:hypothetical protein